jgi:spore coat polysaccharide biosynthesis protein SpsF (cytidylyltransferase family)
MGSTRLPGKVLKPLANESMLSRIVERVEKAERPDCLVLAVTYTESDDPVAEEARSVGADVVRGSEDDVLARLIQAIMRHSLDFVVRLTADNPFVEGRVIDAMINHLRKHSLDYLHNVRDSGYPLGTCVEVVRGSALKEAFAQSDRPKDHEHVTSYVYDTNAGYEVDVFRRDEPADDIRLTVDTEKDYRLASWVYENVEAPTRFGLEDVLDLRAIYPERFEENASVRQKSIHE